MSDRDRWRMGEEIDGKSKSNQIVPIEGPEPRQAVETHEFGIWNPSIWYEVKDAVIWLAVAFNGVHGVAGVVLSGL